MKKCTKCGIEKPETAYFIKDKKIGRLHTQCKQCYKQHRKAYYAEHYAKYHEQYLSRAKNRRAKLRAEFHTNMLDYLAGKSCRDCGETDLRVLELDHVNPKEKSFSVSQAVRLGFSWDEIVAEIKKCQILCANCHKRRTAQQFGWYKAM